MGNIKSLMKSSTREHDAKPLGDMDPLAFREAGHALVDWIAQYLYEGSRYPVQARVAPGDIRSRLPATAPEEGESMEEIFSDFERILVPGLTHWNHPGFMAYFPSTGSGPGALAEFLTAALNQQAMLWRTSPTATELEEVVLSWVRGLLKLPSAFEGVITDGGSMSNLLALLAAREDAAPDVRTHGLVGRREIPPLTIYCTEHAHSSVDKAAIVLGLGQEAIRRIPADDSFRMRAPALQEAIRADRGAGFRPLAVVAAVGATSVSSIDPVSAIADICEREGVWLHVDAAYAGPAAMIPEYEWIFDGVLRADSVLVNPHKWLYTPLDLSALYCRRMGILRRALALTPDYLADRQSGAVTNLMDLGIQLARRFRALKLWMVLRYFGAGGIRARIREHIRLAQQFAQWISQDSDFELLAPVPLSLVCFRAAPRLLKDDEGSLDGLNEALLDRVNASGEIFLSHTRLNGRYALRLVVGHIRTSEIHIAKAWQLLRETANRLVPPDLSPNGISSSSRG
jgi:aromatic-L-amino-acid/L-tryptophan decarboxylase